VDIYVDSAGEITVGYNASYSRGSWSENVGDSGGVYVYHDQAPSRRVMAGYDYDNMHRFELLYHEPEPYVMQFAHPRVARNGNRIHMFWYDTIEQGLKYGTLVNTDPSDGEHAWIAIDGGYDGDDPDHVATGRVASAGVYNAITLDSFGNPVIMYFDDTNKTLRLAVSDQNDPTASTDWTLQDVFQGTDPNRIDSGLNVSMAVDSAGDIHAVFHRASNSSMIYIKSTNGSTRAAGDAFVFGDSVVIENGERASEWADITVEGTTPYISYLDSTRLNSFNGLKVAMFDTANAPGEWEFMNVPLGYIVKRADYNRTSIEYSHQAGTQWDLAVGYNSGDFYRVTYYRPEP
jgi:hypothetical protein